MANELKIDIGLGYSKNGIYINERQSFFVDVSGDNLIHNIQSIGTGAETLQGIDSGTAGFLLIKNLDGTNSIQLGLSGSYTANVGAGESALFRLDTSTPYAIGTSATCDVEYYLFEE